MFVDEKWGRVKHSPRIWETRWGRKEDWEGREPDGGAAEYELVPSGAPPGHSHQRGHNVGQKGTALSSLWRLVTGWFWAAWGESDLLALLWLIPWLQVLQLEAVSQVPFLQQALSKGNLRHNPCKTKLFLPLLSHNICFRFKGSYLKPVSAFFHLPN